MPGKRRGTDDAGITKLPDGRYRVRVTTRGPKGKPVEADRRVDTYEEAVSLRASLRAALETAGEVQRPKRPPTVLDYADTYLDLRKVERAYKPGTVASAVYCLERVCRHIGALRLDEVRRSDLRELAVTLAREWAPRTARLTWTHALACLRDGWAEWGLPDPSQGVHGPSGADEPAGRALDPEEIAALLLAAQAEPKPLYEMFLVAVTTGLRRGELTHIERSRLRLDDASPHLVVGHSKTRAGKGRAAPLAPLVAQALRSWLAQAPESPWLFPRLSDPAQPFVEYTFYRQLLRLAGRNSGQHLSPHDLRRTFLTNLQASAVDATMRMVLAGHASLGQQTVYLRPSTKTLAEAMAPSWRIIEGGRTSDLGTESGDGDGAPHETPTKTTA